MSDSIRDCARGLIARNNSSAQASQVDVRFAEMSLENESHEGLVLHDTRITLDTGRHGPNGLDTGAVAPDTWYYMWIIAGSRSQVAGVISVSPDGPAMPHGYHFKALAGAVQTDSQSQLLPFAQAGRKVARSSIAVVHEGVLSPQFKRIDCTLALPKIAIAVSGDFTLNPDQSKPLGYGEGWVSSGPSDFGPIGVVGFRGQLGPQCWFKAPFAIPVVEPQTLYYGTAPGANILNVDVTISSFEIA